jgi:hypothetical protein
MLSFLPFIHFLITKLNSGVVLQAKCNYKKEFFIVIFILFLASGSFAQTIKLKGYIIDADSKDSIPFATVYVKGTGFGTETEFNGYYELEVPQSYDSLWVSTIGYITKSVVIPHINSVQHLNIFISEDYSIPEIVITPKENPAFRILREVVKHKSINDKRNLRGYEYETYNRTSIFVNNISEKLRQKKSCNK